MSITQQGPAALAPYGVFPASTKSVKFYPRNEKFGSAPRTFLFCLNSVILGGLQQHEGRCLGAKIELVAPSQKQSGVPLLPGATFKHLCPVLSEGAVTLQLQAVP